ncbi:TonB-dependent receptor [Phaeobacter sp.]|uniref:TonB-dependent receptor plug domain-containing protein n=1 Tax=Phaeobacter sp. TaxID=1902409 RepID=UPI0025E87DF3|nr:TonB-dependent receptor [Phaeobacter sp.]
MRKVNLSLAAAMAAAPALGSAADTTDDIKTFVLKPIIISGGLTPIAEDSYGRAASVITGQEITDRGITSVQDALRAVPGLSVSSAGGSGTQVRIRGGEANHTLILIDGVEIAGGDSEYILSGLDTATIDRIEVLRGPQSVFYGSNASAGVINIITKTGGLGTSYETSVEVGSDGHRASAIVSSRSEKGGLTLSLAHDNDGGFDASGDGGEDDRIRRNTVQLKGDYQLTPDSKVGVNLRASDEYFDTDRTNGAASLPTGYVVDDPSQFSDRDEQLVQIWGELTSLNGRLSHRLSFERTDYDFSFNGFAPTETQTDAAKYLLSFGLNGERAAEANHLVNAMLEWEDDSSSANPAYRRSTTSLALEYRGRFANGLDVQLGARRDNNSAFENATSWTASASYLFAGSGIRLHASAGTGIVNPSYFELFANDTFGSATYVGNAALQPEENRSFDIGVTLPFLQGRGLIDVTYFDETLTGEIEAFLQSSDPTTGASVFSYRNQAGDSRRTGVELAANLEATDQLDLGLTYTYLDAANPNGTVKTRRPRHELLLGATWRTEDNRGGLTANIHHVAGTFDTQFFGSFATAELPDYTTVDLSADYELRDGLTLTGRITNLFDEDQSDVWGYAGRGRAAFVGLRAAF